MSEVDIRYDKSKSFGSANLIVHQGMAKIFHQTIELLCTLRVVEEIHKVISGCHWVHSSANLFQPSGSTSGQALNLESELTVPVCFLSLSR